MLPECQLSKHLLVFKTSWRRLQDMSWRLLQHVFSVTIFRLPRRLDYILNMSWRKDVLKMSWGHLASCLEDVLEDEKLLRWRYLHNILKACVEDVLKTCLEYMTNLRHIQNALIRTQYFQYSSDFETQAAFLI